MTYFVEYNAAWMPVAYKTLKGRYYDKENNTRNVRETRRYKHALYDKHKLIIK